MLYVHILKKCRYGNRCTLVAAWKKNRGGREIKGEEGIRSVLREGGGGRDSQKSSAKINIWGEKKGKIILRQENLMREFNETLQ